MRTKIWAIVFTLLSLISFVGQQALIAAAVSSARLENLGTAISVVLLTTWLFLFAALIALALALPVSTELAIRDHFPYTKDEERAVIVFAVALIVILTVILVGLS